MDFTSNGWLAGETVTVYAVSRTPPYGQSGASVTSAVASSGGAAAFTGLDVGDYVAVGGTSARTARFRVAPAQVHSIVVMAQADYDALTSPDGSTLYVISG
jgi:hypothetical protein